MLSEGSTDNLISDITALLRSEEPLSASEALHLYAALIPMGQPVSCNELTRLAAIRSNTLNEWAAADKMWSRRALKAFL